ncbi:flagellar hook-basal body complex protein FliE [Planktotalea sp.]|uniref:flagellar hook-basal body complex protein FliE n=1 Tax=Planktotalea sp. TaxID=2029877 RepID=UPI003D6BFBB8
MDIKSLFASQRYEATKPATDPAVNAQSDIGDSFKDTFKDFSTTLAESENIAKAAMTGDADPHALVQALAQTELAVEAAVTVRDKVVEAYQEILRMPV